MKYRREIDGLRAIAVLSVLFFHAGFPGFSGSYIGVHVFFVISGFLINSIIISAKETGTFSLLTFYERRARRILPALFLVLVACLIPAWLWLPPADMVSFCQQDLIPVKIRRFVRSISTSWNRSLHHSIDLRPEAVIVHPRLEQRKSLL